MKGMHGDVLGCFPYYFPVRQAEKFQGLQEQVTAR